MAVYESLRAMVMAGGIREDERVAESQLAEQLGVSRTPVREALQRLESDGLVRAQGRGIRLRMLSTDELSQLYAARAGLEGWAAFLAAQRVAGGEVAPARLAALEALAAKTHELTFSGDLARAVEANRAFHEAVAALADNPVISGTLERWWDQIVISTRRSLQAPERAQAVHAEHEVILRALRSGDAPGARAAVEAHAFATRDALNENRSETRSSS
jgi:DNA-binding GntR family transcriptional regulator